MSEEEPTLRSSEHAEPVSAPEPVGPLDDSNAPATLPDALRDAVDRVPLELVSEQTRGRGRPSENKGFEQSPQTYDFHPKREEHEAIAAQIENPLYNDPPPNFLIESERPEHRLILYLTAQGMDNAEIASRVGYSRAWVAQVKRQRWFRANLVRLIDEKGGDLVQAFLSGEGLATLETLRDIRDNPSARHADRIAACSHLADRIWGKPTQHVKTERLPTSTEAQDTVAELEQKLASLRTQDIANGLAPQIN